MAKAPRGGFTLIELLVVIAIIAILASILFPVFSRAREKARQTNCLSNTKQLMLGCQMYTQDFDEMLGRLNIDVLALFSEKDTNVNWRKARALYETTIGRNPNASLTIRTFPDGNHNIKVSKTGSVREVEGMQVGSGEKCKDYYKSQIDWLRKYVVPEDK